MRVLVSGLAAAAIWLGATSTEAAPAPAPVVQDQSAEATALQNWLAAISRWNQGYDALTSQMLETLTWLVQGASDLVVKLDNGDARATASWVSIWAAQARAKLEIDMTAYRALSTEAPGFPANVPTTPVLRQRIAVVSRTSDQVGRMVLSLRQASESYIAVMERAASGRSEDLIALESGRMELMITQLDAEIIMVESSSDGFTGPNLHFARAQIATNRAQKAWLEHNRLLFTSQPVDGAASARVVTEQAGVMRQELDSMRATIIDTRRQMRAQPGLIGSPLGDLMMQALGTLERSADVEQRIAGLLDDLATALRSGDETADEVIWARFETLLNERVAIDSERRRLIAQSGA